MKILNLYHCVICYNEHEIKNLKGGICPFCVEKIEEGNDDVLEKYFALPLEELTAHSLFIDNMRMGRK